MGKTGFILLWTSTLTVVLFIWIRLFPPYKAQEVLEGIKNFVSVDEKAIDMETLNNLRKN